MVKLSIIVPTYNEAENLERLVDGIFNTLKGVDFELIIVDDNSPDGTGKLADELASKNKNVAVVHRPGKLGLGTAILDGVAVSHGEIIGVIDADLQHPPEVLKTMLKRAEEGADIVVASRYVSGGNIEGWPLLRKIISRGALWLSHLFLPQTKNVKDTLSGYFLFKKNVIEGAVIDVKEFKMLIEILVKGKYCKVVEVPYTFRTRAAGKSKLGTKQIFSYVRQLLRLSDYRILKFMAVGVSGIVVNNGILWLLVTSAFMSPFFAEIFSIESSILSNFTLNNFWTFRGRKSGGIIYRLLKYHGSVLVGAVVNYVVFLLLLAAGLHILVANTIGILLGFIFNYLLSETFVWRWV
ncbi:MAG: glycosyltransferase family 2 protein [Candidatus Hadarchaeum sp.]|uniref:glycosyltransferase family 2 protein n=1 Tax=Candidatus Hadarchaeum sp. TaxID=2883567 RepID=UPI00317398ED